MEQLEKSRRLRLGILQGVIVVTFLVLVGRIYQLQFIQKDEYRSQADDNRLDEISIPATRGIILDRNGQPLAINTASARVTVTPALLPDDDAETAAVLERLAGLLGIPYTGDPGTVDERGIPVRSVTQLVAEGEGLAPFRPVTIKSDVDHDVARLLIAEGAQFPGIDVEWVSVREYPTGALTSHIIGYMGPIPGDRAEEFEAVGYVLDRDRIGYDGIEFAYQDALAGRPGLQQVVRDVAGEIVGEIGEPQTKQDGYNLTLTLDVDLQRVAQEALVNTINDLKANNPDNLIGYDRGVVIAMNPRTGEVLAMVSWPTYDNTRFARSIDYPYYLQVSRDPLRPLFNQAVNSLYPPGSIFKVITLTGVLEEGVVTASQEIEAPGAIQLENRYYPNDPGQSQEFVCWINRGGGSHGQVNAVEALAWSCDVYFYKVGGGYESEVPGTGLGILRLGEWMQLYGLGSQTGIELAGEAEGFIPDPTWKRRVWGENWSTGDTYNSAFGQGYVLVTPLQMINALNTIANNGIQSRPTLIREVTDADGQVVQIFEPEQTDMRDLVAEYWTANHPLFDTNGDSLLDEDGNPIGQEYPGTLGSTLRVIQEGMRAAVTMEGATAIPAQRDYLPYVPIAAKTGTAEFCDNIAAAVEQCEPGNWPAHAWYMAYAPYGNPEISVIAFVYNGGEGSTVALPVASEVMDAYFQLKAQRAQAAAGEDSTAP